MLQGQYLIDLILRRRIHMGPSVGNEGTYVPPLYRNSSFLVHHGHVVLFYKCSVIINNSSLCDYFRYVHKNYIKYTVHCYYVQEL